MVSKTSQPKTQAYRYVGTFLIAMVVNVLVGTAPASAQSWYYAWANNKCWMTMADAAQRAGMPAPDARIWRSATADRCGKIPVTVSKTPYEKK